VVEGAGGKVLGKVFYAASSCCSIDASIVSMICGSSMLNNASGSAVDKFVFATGRPTVVVEDRDGVELGREIDRRLGHPSMAQPKIEAAQITDGS
jgi:hypothetical protein